MPPKKLDKIKLESGVTLPNTTPKAHPKKKKKNPDPAYIDKRKPLTQAPKKDIYALRANKALTVKKPDGKNTPLKTAVAIHGSPFLGLLNTEKKKALHKTYTVKIPSHIKVKEWQYSADGTPKCAITEDNKKLYPTTNNGIFYFFSNQAQLDQKTEKPAQRVILTRSKAKQTKQAKQITPPQTIQKEVKVHLSTKLLDLVAKEIKKNNGKRKQSQNKVMGGSAADQTQVAGLSLKNMSEWGHLVAYRFLCEISQHRDNLVSMTKEANTEMMVIENVLAKLAQASPGGIDLHVVADLIQGTHVATKVNYKVTFGNYEIPFVFDCQQATQPHISNAEIVKLFFNILFSDEKKAASTSIKASTASPAPQFIFSKSLQASKRKLDFSATSSEEKDQSIKVKLQRK